MTRWWLAARAGGALAAGLLALAPAPAPAQALRLGSWGGSVGASVDAVRDDSTLGDVSGRTRATLLEERLTLRNTGASVYDPRLLSLSLEGTVAHVQAWSRTGGHAGSAGSLLWGYDAAAQLLREKPWSLGAYASRSQLAANRSLSGGTANTLENRGATLTADGLLVPSSLSFRQERWSERPLGRGAALHDERRDVLGYLGQRGWLDGDLELRYELVDSSDRASSRLAYRRHEASLDLGQDFGPELTWHWDSRARASRQTGVVDLRRATLEERLRVEHSDSLQTQARYGLVWTGASGGSMATHSGEVSLRHLLYDSLTTELRGEAVLQRIEGGRIDTFGAGGDVGYTRRLPGDARLNARLAGSLHHEDHRLRAQAAFVPQETLVFASPVALSIGLRNAFVLTASVVVTKVAAGPLPAGCIAPSSPPIPLVEGRDYTLRADGDVTEIVPIPCSGSTPGINPEDTVTVDYRYTLAPSIAFRTASWRADLSVDLGWIRPFLAHQRKAQALVSGRDGRFLDDQRTDSAGVELRHQGERFRAGALIEVRRFTSRRQDDHRSLTAGETASYTPTRVLSLTARADQSVREYVGTGRRTETEAAGLGFLLAPESTFSVEGSAAIRWTRDPPSPRERTVEASAQARWALRQLDVRPALAFVDRRRGDSRLQEYRGTVVVTRRF